MSVLRRTRTEVAGAWRSLRYDLGREPVRPPAGGPDVTSTGMGTWGLEGLVEPDPAPPARRPRRAVAMTVFGTLTVVGAAGAYLVVVNGLGSLMTEQPAAADTLAPRVAVTTTVGMGPSSRAATAGRTTVAVPRSPAGVAVPPPAPAAPQPPQAAAVPPPVQAKSPIRTTKPASPECHCEPPVPTPTAPTSPPSPTPSLSPSPSSSASAGPSPSESADASASPSPSRSWDGKRHRRHH
ncbi:hypothetical protein M1L60_36535 [Actinoplanes sp. TRM 88003]|uniref:Uncharacterized protein n=1 Tax=Paractinoplanes aksuensis TaxID=2939490 RepID=A0ABT1DYY9_9ACTN|nr:hypothetical protein [Actinoplanes aksuensis]MCO8276099.1 hypothetical protein [Actinoplanes aksuensis]